MWRQLVDWKLWGLQSPLQIWMILRSKDEEGRRCVSLDTQCRLYHIAQIIWWMKSEWFFEMPIFFGDGSSVLEIIDSTISNRFIHVNLCSGVVWESVVRMTRVPSMLASSGSVRWCMLTWTTGSNPVYPNRARVCTTKSKFMLLHYRMRCLHLCPCSFAVGQACCVGCFVASCMLGRLK